MKVYYTIFLLIVVFQSQAQNAVKLSAGDKLPSNAFPVKNYHNDTINLDDYKDKLILIDIWDVTCSGCIKGIAKMEELQEKFKDKIKIILLSDDSWEAIEKLKSRSEIVKNTKLPMIIGDSGLANKIKYIFLPTYLWIENGNQISNITDLKVATEKGVQEFLKKGKGFAENKKEMKVNQREPLFPQFYPVIGNNFMFYSFLAKLDFFVASPSDAFRNYDLPDKPIRKVISIHNIRLLYRTTYGDEFKHKVLSRVIFEDPALEAADTSRYVFEMLINKSLPDQKVLELARQQLDLNLGMTSRVDTLLRDVYVLKRIKGIPIEKLTSDKVHLKATDDIDSREKLVAKNTIWAIVQYAVLNGGRTRTPFEIIDETGIDIETAVTFEIPQDLSLNNLSNVNKKLREVGLELEHTKRQLDMIVISKI